MFFIQFFFLKCICSSLEIYFQICQVAQNAPPFVNYPLVRDKSNKHASNLYLLTVNGHFCPIKSIPAHILYLYPHVFVLWWLPSFCLIQRLRNVKHLNQQWFLLCFLILMRENVQGKMKWVKKLLKIDFQGV